MVKTRSSARLLGESPSNGESSRGFYDNLPPDRVEKPIKKGKRGRKSKSHDHVLITPLSIPIRPIASITSSTSVTSSVPPVATVAPISVINYSNSTAPPRPSILQPTVSLTHQPYIQMVPNQVPQVVQQPQVPVITSQSSISPPRSQMVHQWIMTQSNRGDGIMENIPLSRVMEMEQNIANNYLNSLKIGGNRYPVHPDVKFKRLPFYQELAELMKPSTLMSKAESGVQENTFYFHLTPQQAQQIMNAPEANVMQAQLRFCKVETSCEQDDCFPPSIGVKINNRVCPLPMPVPTNKCYVEPKRPPGPVNITSLLKLSPTVANQIVITWMNDYMVRYAVTVNFVKKLTPNNLITRLKSKGTKNADYTRSLIKEKLREDLDCEIATTSLRVSLVCPLGKMRMLCPCRPLTCIHLQCFDASIFLAMNEKKPSWVCPVCDKPALYDNLVVDGYFLEVLSSSRLAPDCTEIQLHKDGSWSAHVKTDIIPQQIFNDVEVIPDDDVIPLSDGSDSSTGLPSLKRGAASSEEFPDQPSPRPPPSNASNTSNPVVVGSTTVDLTSDSDDDLPLRRKIPKKHQQQDVSSSKDTDADKSCSKKNQRHSSLDLAVSSIISLDSPSPLTVPTSPNGNSSDAAMIVDALDPIMDLDAETTEALKQISTNEQPIDLETPERISPPSSPASCNSNSPDSTKDKKDENDQESDPIAVRPEAKTDSGEGNADECPASSPRPRVVTPDRMPIEALEKLIDIANTSETNEAELPDPLEIEESICNITVTSATFADGDNHRIDFVKDPIRDVLGKDFTSEENKLGSESESPQKREEEPDSSFDTNAETEEGTKKNTETNKEEIKEKSEGEEKNKAASKKSDDEAEKETDSEDDEDDDEAESDSKGDDTDKETDSDNEEEEEEEEEEDEDESEDDNEPETIVDTVP